MRVKSIGQFITTESLQGYGITAESLTWEKIQLAFQQRYCVGYWRYPIFSHSK